MKKILILAIAIFTTEVLIAQYIFNFSEGKSASWSNPANWSGGVVPPLDITSVSVVPPDNSDGWLCQVDVDGIVCHNSFTIGSRAKVTIQNGIIFRSFNNVTIEDSAELNLIGDLGLFCPFNIQNNGTVVIALTGSLGLDANSGDCPATESSFTNNGPLFVNGRININRTRITCNNLFWNKGYLTFGLSSELNLNSNAVNDGNITGSTTISAKNLVNNNVIDLRGHDVFISGLVVNGLLLNNKKILTESTLYLKGHIVNKGDFEAHFISSAIFDTVTIDNYAGFAVVESAFGKMVASFFNNGTSMFQSTDQYEIFHSQMDIINNGDLDISTGATYLDKGSVINNNNMSFTAQVDSNRIKIPFINKGMLTSYGPLKLGDAFINSGEIIIQ